MSFRVSPHLTGLLHSSTPGVPALDRQPGGWVRSSLSPADDAVAPGVFLGGNHTVFARASCVSTITFGSPQTRCHIWARPVPQIIDLHCMAMIDNTYTEFIGIGRKRSDDKGRSDKAPDAARAAGQAKAHARRGAPPVTGLFDLMVEALQRGEEVELPFGRLEVAEHRRKPVRGWFLGRVRVTYRKRKFVRFVAEEGCCESNRRL
jgi:nucleoid DNA-binding protein